MNHKIEEDCLTRTFIALGEAAMQLTAPFENAEDMPAPERIILRHLCAAMANLLAGCGGSYGGSKQVNLMREAAMVGFSPEFYPGQQIRVFFQHPRWEA